MATREALARLSAVFGQMSTPFTYQDPGMRMQSAQILQNAENEIVAEQQKKALKKQKKQQKAATLGEVAGSFTPLFEHLSQPAVTTAAGGDSGTIANSALRGITNDRATAGKAVEMVMRVYGGGKGGGMMGGGGGGGGASVPGANAGGMGGQGVSSAGGAPTSKGSGFGPGTESRTSSLGYNLGGQGQQGSVGPATGLYPDKQRQQIY